MILQADAVTVTKGGRTILRQVSLAARPGELLGLIGPNGAGKTTLLRVLAGLEAPQSGAMLFDGRSAAQVGPRALGRALAYLAQNGRIHWPMAVAHVVALGRLPHGGESDARTREAVARAMARADVTALAHRPTGSLSGGERMRALLARALAVEAPALLADEPVAALDPYHQLHAMEVLRAEARAGAAVVVVLHDLTLAARFCDRLALLQDGRILAAGPPPEVLDPAVLDPAFGVRTARGVVEGEPYVLPWRRMTPAAPVDRTPADRDPP